MKAPIAIAIEIQTTRERGEECLAKTRRWYGGLERTGVIALVVQVPSTKYQVRTSDARPHTLDAF